MFIYCGSIRTYMSLVKNCFYSNLNQWRDCIAFNKSLTNGGRGGCLCSNAPKTADSPSCLSICLIKKKLIHCHIVGSFVHICTSKKLIHFHFNWTILSILEMENVDSAFAPEHGSVLSKCIVPASILKVSCNQYNGSFQNNLYIEAKLWCYIL